MAALLLFATALLLAALISEFAHRSIVSTAVLFLVAGFLGGPRFADIIPIGPESHLLQNLAEFAMFVVLFTDGMELAGRDLLRSWKLPTLALGIGLPLTVGGTALLAHYVAGVDWLAAFLIGAVLSPTDPVFASAIVARREIPGQLRDLLNIESGLNDGLALPLVIALLAVGTGEEIGAWKLAGDVVFGVGLGIVVPWVAHRIEQLRAFTVAESHEALFALAIGLLVFAIASLTGVNMFLAAFAAGVTVVTLQPRFSKTFREFSELISELLKLATVMFFGALLSTHVFNEIPASGYVFALLALLLIRPIALELAFARAEISRAQRAAAYWFGPKGFASIVYGIYVLRAGLPGGEELFRLIGLVVAFSIVAHSSTDVVVARWFEQHRGAWQGVRSLLSPVRRRGANDPGHAPPA